MEIFPECARIVCPTPVQGEPVRYVPMVMAYEELEPGRLRIRLRPGTDWRECTYRLEEGIIYWRWGGKEWPWEPISEEELPGWYRAFETRARQLFDERGAAAAK